MSVLIPSEVVERKIYLIRGKKVMVDRDLAELYGVPTKSLNLAVKRNLDRFPADFMFQLNLQESAFLRFQFETSKMGRGGRRYLPYVFTQEGIGMLSGVLNSPRAVQVNIAIMRAFVKLRAQFRIVFVLTFQKFYRKLYRGSEDYPNYFYHN